MSDEASAQEGSSSADVWSTVGDFVAVLLLAGAVAAITVALATRSAGGSRGLSRRPDGTLTPTVMVDLSEFNVTVSQFASVSAGRVTFVVKNSGSLDHEMIVLETDTPFTKLPIVDAGDPPVPVKTKADKVDEASNVGETGDPNLKPGVIRTFTIKNLRAGRYALVCNLAKHYGLGMRAAFTVT